MTSTEALRHRGLFVFYYALVVLSAAGLLLHFTPHAIRHPLLVPGMVLLLMLMADAKPVPLPSGGYATASGLFDLPSLVVLGPVYTAWLSLASTLVNEGLIQRRPAIRVIHNLAIFTLTCFAAAWGFALAGGRVGTMAFPRDLPALLACGAAYFATNSVLVSTVIGLTSGPSPWRVWQSNFQRGIFHHLSFIALGSLVVVVYFYVGPWALVLFGVPFLVARHSFGLYMEIKSDLKDFVRALTEVLEEIDPYTRHHSVRVSQYAVRLARGLRLSERALARGRALRARARRLHPVRRGGGLLSDAPPRAGTLRAPAEPHQRGPAPAPHSAPAGAGLMRYREAGVDIPRADAIKRRIGRA